MTRAQQIHTRLEELEDQFTYRGGPGATLDTFREISELRAELDAIAATEEPSTKNDEP